MTETRVCADEITHETVANLGSRKRNTQRSRLYSEEQICMTQSAEAAGSSSESRSNGHVEAGALASSTCIDGGHSEDVG